MAEPVRVLYVMGHGWSGSTILGNLLGELEGFFHAGELRRAVGRGAGLRARCGCGELLLRYGYPIRAPQQPMTSS